jgi:hypothetical protein
VLNFEKENFIFVNLNEQKSPTFITPLPPPSAKERFLFLDSWLSFHTPHKIKISPGSGETQRNQVLTRTRQAKLSLKVCGVN